MEGKPDNICRGHETGGGFGEELIEDNECVGKVCWSRKLNVNL